MSPREHLPVVDMLATLTLADRQAWSLLTGSHDLEEVGERLRRVAHLPRLADISELTPPHRIPLVVGHGPGIEPALPAIAAHRERLWVLAPFRSAIALLDTGLAPDVIILADRDTWPIRASFEQWQSQSAERKRRLTAATLVIDAFAPADLVQQWSRVFLVDTGPGAGTPVPLFGSGVLAALSIVFGLGHRHVSLGGVDLNPGTKVGDFVARLRGANDVELVELGTDGFAALLATGPRTAPRRPEWQSRPSAAAAAAALAVAAGELEVLASLLRAVEAGLTYAPADPRLARLVDDIRWRWPSIPSARAAVHRADCRWLTALWELTAAPIVPLHDASSILMTSRLVLRPLASALANHLRDCRGCVARAFGHGTDVVARL